MNFSKSISRIFIVMAVVVFVGGIVAPICCVSYEIGLIVACFAAVAAWGTMKHYNL